MPIWAMWTLWIVGGIAFLSLIGVISYKFRDEFILFEGICILLDYFGGIAEAFGDVVSDIDIDIGGD